MFSNDLVCDILEYIDNNINNKISIKDICDKFYYNRYYIMKLFKREIGVSINNYINNIRIYNSTKLIKDSNYSMLMIGLYNGFYSLEYFSEMFKKIIGVSPLKYKKYSRNRFLLDDKDVDKILNGIINLKLLIDFKNEYKNNRKPKEAPVRKLSIFN
ncbi:MAG: AraC family transcriptional regulator [Bacilli bacterium]|nr:AraC family transcriptional regulator [Bacilli bacterium]